MLAGADNRLLVLVCCVYTDISRKVVGKNVHATIPKGNMGYDQYTVPDTVAVEPTLGSRDFSCAVSGFGRLRPVRQKTCRPAADEAPRHTREKIYVTQGNCPRRDFAQRRNPEEAP